MSDRWDPPQELSTHAPEVELDVTGIGHDTAGHEATARDTTWAGRYGFGRVALALILVAGGIRPGRAAGQALRPGELVEHATSATDSSQHYAFYLPTHYTTNQRWPLVILMDARGRALVPLRCFQAAAERGGYILMSSYNTMSDGLVQPNVAAVNAMLADAHASFSLAPQRLYLAGFSGTARLAWDFAYQLGDQVAGIFGASAAAGPQPPWGPVDDPPNVAFFGTAGFQDYNYEEMGAFRKQLTAWGLPHRIRFFVGFHSWPPAELCGAALDWFTLQAMRSGFVPQRASFVDSLYTHDLAQTTALEASGDSLMAFEELREMEADYRGLRATDDVTAQRVQLEATRAVRRGQKRERALLADAVSYDRRMWAYLERFRQATDPPGPAAVIHDLQVRRLEKQAANSADRLAAGAAVRVLERVFVNASFYGPREYLAQGKWKHALSLLEVADTIRRDQPAVLVDLARALTQLGRTGEALTDLERAVAIGTDRQALGRDPLLAPLREEARFQALLHGQ